MREKIIALLRQIDDDIVNGELFNGAPIEIYIIGGAAIALGIDSTATTTDIDIAEPFGSRLDELRIRYGQNTDAPERFGVYLQIVSDAFALLPPTSQYRERAVEITIVRGERIRVFRIQDVDLIISKIKRFSVRDRNDIKRIVDHSVGDIDAATLRSRLTDLSMYVEDDFEELSARLDKVIHYLDGTTDVI